jgi:hypothetical protein
MASARLIRVHQEDTCQALGIMPTKKYQNEGGPSAANIIELLRTYSTDRDTDLDVTALGFNWLIAGNLRHAIQTFDNEITSSGAPNKIAGRYRDRVGSKKSKSNTQATKTNVSALHLAAPIKEPAGFKIESKQGNLTQLRILATDSRHSRPSP